GPNNLIMKVDSRGQIEWMKTLPQVYMYDAIWELVSDEFGNSYALGYFAQPTKIGNILVPGFPETLTTVPLFLIGFDRSGDARWALPVQAKISAHLLVRPDGSQILIVSGGQTASLQSFSYSPPSPPRFTGTPELIVAS